MSLRAKRIIAKVRAVHPKGAITTKLPVRQGMRDQEVNELWSALRWHEKRIVCITAGDGWMRFRIAQRRK